MNVEITDNSKEVSGAIHQVGQAIADTGGFLQVRKVSAARSLHVTVAVLYPGRFLRALQPFCVRGNFSSKAAGMRPALRLRRKSLSHLLLVSWYFYRKVSETDSICILLSILDSVKWKLSKTDTFSCTGTQELVQ